MVSWWVWDTVGGNPRIQQKNLEVEALEMEVYHDPQSWSKDRMVGMVGMVGIVTIALGSHIISNNEGQSSIVHIY